MFLIDSTNKTVEPVEKKTFAELGFSERQDLQEWICNNPKLLAGGAVASEMICEFLGDDDFENIRLNSGEQRAILVAAKFRKEVTATVLFLNNHQLDIKCVKVTPYQDGDRLYLDAEQILPVQEVEEYQVRLSAKERESAVAKRAESTFSGLRREFWEIAKPAIFERAAVLKERAAATNDGFSVSSGHSGIRYSSYSLKDCIRTEVYIDTGDKDRNKKIFDYLFEKKDELDTAVGRPLAWQRLPDKRACRIYASFDGCVLSNRETWDDGIAWLAEYPERFYNTFKKPLDDAAKKSK